MLARGVRRQAAAAVLLGWLAAAAGCALGPRTLEATRLPYNEAVKTTAEQQLLLNIVRLRYVDTPSSLAVSAIAAQRERMYGLRLIPFFTASGDADPRGFSAVLPQVELTGADRPTITLTPQDDQEFTRRLFTPLPLEGILYLSKTTWPIATVFRLWLENLNWVPNAQLASGPTPKEAPEFADFLHGVEALQRLQDRGQIVFVPEDREEKASGPLPGAQMNPQALVEAAKAGHEYRPDDKGGTWTLVKKKQQPVLHVHPHAVNSPEMQEVVRIFRLRPGRDKYDVDVEKLNPFPINYPPEGVTSLDLETRSLLQVLYFVAQGVMVPPEHEVQGLVTVTREADGEPFDWQQVMRGLFKVCWAEGKRPPCTAHVAVCYKGYWFYIDETDQASKATFSLLLEVSRLELTSKTGVGPLLTLPIGGR